MRRAILLTTLGAALAMGLAPSAEARKSKPAAQKPAAAAADLATTLPPILDAQQRLGYNLITRLGEGRKTVNLSVSPASLASVLSLIDLGASPPLRAAIHKTIGYQGKDAEADADLDALREALNPLSQPAAGSPLAYVNAFVFDPAAPPLQKAVYALKGAGAQVSVEPLADPKTVADINKLVSDTTRGLIPTIIDEPLQGTGLVAINALHFKANWRTAFDPRATKQETFTRVDGKTETVPIMHSPQQSLLMREDEHFVAVSLGYAVKGYSLVLLTTKGKPAAPAEFAPAAAWLAGEDFREVEGEVALPSFALSGTNNLLDPADRLGLSPARRNMTALRDLSATPQSINVILQKSVITVDETGTEAAAATMAATPRSIQLNRIAIAFDKPFLFALRQEQSGLLLMTGYVGDPAAAPAKGR